MTAGIVVLCLLQLAVYARMNLPEEKITKNIKTVDRSFLRNKNFWLGAAILFFYVSTEYAIDTEIRMYDRLFTQENVFDLPEGQTYMDLLNTDSLTVMKNCKVEPALAEAKAEDRFQFVRNGYFCVDYKDSAEGAPVFNRIVGLKSSFKLPKK